jgi:hypothetical protein
VDGDGRLDLVAANYGMNTVSIFKNQCVPGSITTNSFGPRVDFPVGTGPQGVAVQDLDGDGKPDNVTANYGDNTISVLRNLGTTGVIAINSFAPAVSFAGGAGSSGVAIADLDGDAKPDVVAVNYVNGNNNAVSVFRNVSTLGNIAFASRIDFPRPIYSYKLAIGDMDGDGKLDVVFVSFANGQSVSVYRNTSTPGSITFASRIDFGLGGWGNGMALGDLDGDGKPDVAAVTQSPANSPCSETSARRAASPTVHWRRGWISPREQTRMAWPSGIWMAMADPTSSSPTIPAIHSPSTKMWFPSSHSLLCSQPVAPM